MKTFLFALAAGFIPALIASNGAYAQNSVNSEVLEPQKNIIKVQKAITLNNNTGDLAGISPKALKSFTQAYKNVTGESWEKINAGFIAKFSQDGVRNIIYFNNAGKWTGYLKGYMEDKMPAYIRRIVKREYYDYNITYVQEAQTLDSEGKPTYIIHLEDKSTIKLVRIFEGQMDIYREYKKQS